MPSQNCSLLFVFLSLLQIFTCFLLSGEVHYHSHGNTRKFSNGSVKLSYPSPFYTKPQNKLAQLHSRYIYDFMSFQPFSLTGDINQKYVSYMVNKPELKILVTGFRDWEMFKCEHGVMTPLLQFMEIFFALYIRLDKPPGARLASYVSWLSQAIHSTGS